VIRFLLHPPANITNDELFFAGRVMQKLLFGKVTAFGGIDTRFRTVHVVAIIEIGVEDVYPFCSSCLAGGNLCGHQER
jgi:hypothetical protein